LTVNTFYAIFTSAPCSVLQHFLLQCAQGVVLVSCSTSACPRALTLKNRPILGTVIAFGVAAASQLVSIPDHAVTLVTAQESTATTETQVLAYEETTTPRSHVRADVESEVEAYFQDIPIMAKVAWCESRHTHINPATGKVLRGRVNSSDVGVMQINLYYHEERAKSLNLNLFDLSDNMAYARKLYEEQGTQPWSASRACWGARELALR